ncbi:uncharacterized protein SOCE26_016900 [Sorangium cellulosum]|uniref:Uncharacterized protein n=1 Tax=Sorangium cellulosum TaxID=56 RepID=A0A2L0ELY3_SORCE|nr:DUF5989 family protein [Sorangium cellulosum]AUX40290.1 uncharacterized protein SOCE26_016900 [Sorangium cellulosum]
MTPKQSTTSLVLSRLTTARHLFRHFTHRRRLFMLPLLLFLMVSGLLLVVTGGLSYVAPFVYAVF